MKDSEIIILVCQSSCILFVLILIVTTITTRIKEYLEKKKNKETAKKLDTELKIKFSSVPVKRLRHCVSCKLNLIDGSFFEFFVGNWVFSYSETTYEQIDTSSPSDDHQKYQTFKFRVDHFHFSPDAKVLANICQKCLNNHVDREIAVAKHKLDQYLVSTKKLDTGVKNISKGCLYFPFAGVIAVFLIPVLLFTLTFFIDIDRWLSIDLISIDLLPGLGMLCASVFCLAAIMSFAVVILNHMKAQRDAVNEFDNKINTLSHNKQLIRQTLTKNALEPLFRNSNQSVIEAKESIYKTQKINIG